MQLKSKIVLARTVAVDKERAGLSLEFQHLPRGVPSPFSMPILPRLLQSQVRSTSEIGLSHGQRNVSEFIPPSA